MKIDSSKHETSLLNKIVVSSAVTFTSDINISLSLYRVLTLMVTNLKCQRKEQTKRQLNLLVINASSTEKKEECLAVVWGYNPN